jgi:hypothetical protein
MKYTKKQLVEAMKKYNENFIDSKETFTEIDETLECAENQVEYLLSLVKN